MQIIELSALPNGAHRNQSAPLSAVPDGWAVVPEGMPLPDTFPFVTLTAEPLGGVLTVSAIDPAPVPQDEDDEPEADSEPEPEPASGDET
jgi:hypothetical protein